MLAARANLIPPQRQRPVAPPQTRIHPTRIAELRARLAAPPHARAMRMTMRALRRARRSAVVRVCLVIALVRRYERGRAHLVALQEVEPTGVAQRPVRRGVTSPQGGRGRIAVRARLPARGAVGAFASRACGATVRGQTTS
jgi:hypothetical protein